MHNQEIRVHPPNTQRYGKPYSGHSARRPIIPPGGRAGGNPRFKLKSSRPQYNAGQAFSPVVTNAPISPQEALIRYKAFLNEYEKEEIISFPDIYYVGKANRKLIADPENELNYGFDNDTHNYNLIAGDHLAYRFEILSLFGAGAFGQVCRCFDHKTQQHVAVKVVVNTSQMHEQGRIEAQILARLNKHDVKNVVKAYDFFIFRSHICITFEILSKNLYEIIEQNDFKGMPPKLVRLYAIQILTALEQVHKLNVVHCDLKPENILLQKDSTTIVKLIDFGSSCFVGHQMYEYIQSRFYRAPEVMLGIKYGPPMDMWSFGLILVELMTGTPLFPGDNEEEELWMITQLIGKPPKKLVAMGKRREEFFDENFELLHEQTAKNYVPNSMKLSTVLRTEDTQLIDFLMKCFTWDQSNRMTASEGLQHPWIRSIDVAVHKKKSSMLPDLK